MTAMVFILGWVSGWACILVLWLVARCRKPALGGIVWLAAGHGTTTWRGRKVYVRRAPRDRFGLRDEVDRTTCIWADTGEACNPFVKRAVLRAMTRDDFKATVFHEKTLMLED